MDIESKSVEDFHRNDDPSNTEQMHGWIWNPLLSSPQSGKTHDDEQRSSKKWRQCCSDNPPQNGPYKDHSGKKAIPEPSLTMNSHIGYTVRCCGFIHGSITFDGTGLVGLLVFRAEQGCNLSNGFIRFLLRNSLFSDVLVFRLLNYELAEVDSASTAEFFLTEDIVFH